MTDFSRHILTWTINLPSGNQKNEFLRNVAPTKMSHFHLTNDYLKFSLRPHTRHLLSLLRRQLKHGKKRRKNPNQLEFGLVRRLGKPFSYNHFFFYLDFISPLSLASLSQMFEKWQLHTFYLDKGLCKSITATAYV